MERCGRVNAWQGVPGDGLPWGAVRDRTATFRIAKLRGLFGEALCIVTSVSSVDVALRLLHVQELEAEMDLELDNGRCYALELVWHRDKTALFRTLSHLDVPLFLSDFGPCPRREIRLNVHYPLGVFVDEIGHEAVLLDISREGARIETDAVLVPGQRVRLDCAPLPDLDACVCWCSGDECGLVLALPISLDDLAFRAQFMQDAGEDPPEPFVPFEKIARIALH